ncbi:MAG: hypothetical protein ACQERD_08250 [Campylobacterota bacterium]
MNKIKDNENSSLWTPNIKNWLEKREYKKIFYNKGDLFFLYGDEKYSFSDVMFFNAFFEYITSYLVKEDEGVYLYIQTKQRVITCYKSRMNDKDYTDASELAEALSSFRNKKLRQKYQNNKKIKLSCTDDNRCQIELIPGNTMHLIDAKNEQNFQILAIKEKQDVVAFATNGGEFQFAYEYISDYFYLAQTKEYQKLTKKYNTKMFWLHTIKVVVLYGILLSQILNLYTPDNDIVEVALVLLSLWGIFLFYSHVVSYILAPIARYFYD